MLCNNTRVNRRRAVTVRHGAAGEQSARTGPGVAAFSYKTCDYLPSKPGTCIILLKHTFKKATMEGLTVSCLIHIV